MQTSPSEIMLKDAWKDFAEAALNETKTNIQNSAFSPPIVSVVSFVPPFNVKNHRGGDIQFAYFSQEKLMHRYYCEKMVDMVISKNQAPLFLIHTAASFVDNTDIATGAIEIKNREIAIMQTIVGRYDLEPLHRFWKATPNGKGSYEIAEWDGGENKAVFIPEELLDIFQVYCKPREYIVPSPDEHHTISKHNKKNLEKNIPALMQLPADEVFPRSVAGIYVSASSSSGVFITKGIEIGEFVGEKKHFAPFLPFKLQLFTKRIKDRGDEPLAVMMILVPDDSPFGKYTSICCYSGKSPDGPGVEIEIMELVDGKAIITAPSIEQIRLLPPEWLALFPKSYLE